MENDTIAQTFQQACRQSFFQEATAAGNAEFGMGMLAGLLAAAVIYAASSKLEKMPALTLSPARKGYLGAGSFLIVLGTVGFAVLDEQGPVDAFYCACITLSTVGYGDICPTHKSIAMMAFVGVYAILGLGVFTGPFLDCMAEWKAAVQEDAQSFCGTVALLLALLASSTAIFSAIEGWCTLDAMYFSIITGTTIGYGDHPAFTTQAGKLAAAFFALASVNVMGVITGAIGDFLKDALFGESRVHLLGYVGCLLAVGTAGFVALDGQNIVDAFYCSCITLSTVGYGDICPATKSIAMKVFVVTLALLGLGTFCGPFLDLMAAWKDHMQKLTGARLAGATLLFSTLLCISVALFTTIEGWSVSEAMYFAVITGTTIGYGDHPSFRTDHGKLAAAMFALVSINAMGAVISTIGDMWGLALEKKAKDD